MENADEQKTFKKIKTILSNYLKKNDVHNVTIYLSTKKPQADSKTHKFVKAYHIL